MSFHLVEKKLKPFKAKDRLRFVAGGDQRGRPVRKVGLEIFVGTAEMADMRVAVDEAGSDDKSLCIEAPGRRSGGVGCAWPDVAYSSIQDGDFESAQDLSGIDVDELSAGYDQIRLDLAHCPADESLDLYLRAVHRNHLFNISHPDLLYQKPQVERGSCLEVSFQVIILLTEFW